MLRFYAKDDDASREIVEALEELAIVHEIIPPDGDRHPPNGAATPVLDDDGTLVEGRKRILEYLRGLQDFKDQWYKFQSDACYCDDDGDIA
jgi:hypothetical protein